MASGYILLLASCATSQGRVVNTEEGRLAAIAVAQTEPDARIEAITRAQNYCQKKGDQAIFRDDVLKKSSKKPFELDLRNVPVIGRVLKSENRTEVTVRFRCVG